MSWIAWPSNTGRRTTYAFDNGPQAVTDPGGVLRQGVEAHAEYARLGSDNQLRMSGYNLAAVMAGLPGNELFAPPPPPPIAPPQRPLISGVRFQ